MNYCLADDLLVGAGPIAKEVRGEDTEKNRRWVYHRHQQKLLPTWKQGADIITRRSLLQQHFSPPAKELAE